MSGKTIVIANMGLAFDGKAIGREALGGVESATISLAEALARAGHHVCVYNNRETSTLCHGVYWKPLKQGMPLRADLYVANRNHELLLGVPFAKTRALWLHNPAWEIDNWKFRWKMALFPPKVIVLGNYHRSTCPAWLKKHDVVTIPLGLSEPFLTAQEATQPPPRRAIFTSNPGRNLNWLLQMWSERIHPRVPDAELHLFSGPEVYRMRSGTGFDLMTGVLAAADALADRGVVRHQPVGRDALVGWIGGSRVMLYRGHQDETFCLALAEAQALGVPCVVQPIGSTIERVRDAATGFIADDDDAFARQAVRLLTDDGLWMTMHRAALASQRSRTWNVVAREFGSLMSQ
jgi:glycosyltransferase involved in cell wall biosynthesis